MHEIADRYRRRADRFHALIVGVREGQWTNPSPCVEWDALGVVEHIIDMHRYTLRPLGHDLSPGPSVREDPLGAFVSASADVEALLDDPEIAESECDGPAGRMVVQDQVDQMVSTDIVLHCWDLARATGQDDTMAPEDVTQLWAEMSAIPAELMERYRTPGAFGEGVEVFGAEVRVAADASTQDRLLGIVGRDPQWTAAD